MITGYDGTFLVDSKTAELVKLVIRTDRFSLRNCNLLCLYNARLHPCRRCRLPVHGLPSLERTRHAGQGGFADILHGAADFSFLSHAAPWQVVALRYCLS